MDDLSFNICLCIHVCFSEFYEDILSIICTCTCFEISQSMWSVFYMLYDAYQRDAFDYFAGKVSKSNIYYVRIHKRKRQKLSLLRLLPTWLFCCAKMIPVETC